MLALLNSLTCVRNCLHNLHSCQEHAVLFIPRCHRQPHLQLTLCYVA